MSRGQAVNDWCLRLRRPVTIQSVIEFVRHDEQHRVATGWPAAGPILRSQLSESFNVTNASFTELGVER